jgi:histidinol dehydrogenase
MATHSTSFSFSVFLFPVPPLYFLPRPKAEHDVDARPILVAVGDPSIVDRVNAELQAQLATLSTAPVAREAVAKGFAVVAQDVDDAIALSDKVRAG